MTLLQFSQRTFNRYLFDKDHKTGNYILPEQTLKNILCYLYSVMKKIDSILADWDKHYSDYIAIVNVNVGCGKRKKQSKSKTNKSKKK